jgi:hypothetical protein
VLVGGQSFHLVSCLARVEACVHNRFVFMGRGSLTDQGAGTDGRTVGNLNRVWPLTHGVGVAAEERVDHSQAPGSHSHQSAMCNGMPCYPEQGELFRAWPK